MSTLCFDIEAIGGHTEEQAAAITEMAEARDMEPDAFAALCPPLARVVCCAFLNLGTGNSRVYLDGDLLGEPAGPAAEPGYAFFSGEVELLKMINVTVAQAHRLVTFNGRSYDLPVLIHRSLAREITPCSKLVQAAREYRYKPNIHHDVREAATFFGASNIGTLRAYCLGYGLPDPKAHGSGKEVPALVAAKDWKSLGTYCLGDVRRTAELYRRMTGAGLV